MYRIEDKKAAILEVQRFLLIIAEREDFIPQLPQDGVYSNETRAAVKDYQGRRGIKETGVVDKETFDLLYFESEEILAEKDIKKSVLNHESFPLKLGDSGADVSNLNTILRELAVYYKNISPLPVGGFFSRNTTDAVKVMQYHLRVREDGIVTATFYDMLRTELKERKKFAK
jgi:peptidoglycan hydrolase-like protein with peptidoglycan-binding domain